MGFRVTVSFEYDLKPVQTVRYDLDSTDFSSAFKTGLFRAEKEFPKANPRSMVACVEKTG